MVLQPSFPNDGRRRQLLTPPLWIQRGICQCLESELPQVYLPLLLLRAAAGGNQVVVPLHVRMTLVALFASSQSHRYFGAYAEDILQRFFEKFEEWELQLVLEDLTKAGFASDDISTLTGKTLSDIPSTLLYRMVANWKVFSDARIQTLFSHCIPARIVSDWPMRSPPPGLLMLHMGQSKTLRDWARKQTLSCEVGLLAPHQFTESYSLSLLAMASVITSPAYASPESLLLSTEPPVVWAAFGTMLRLVPVENLMPSRMQTIDLRHIVSGHLHDTGSRKYQHICLR